MAVSVRVLKENSRGQIIYVKKFEGDFGVRYSVEVHHKGKLRADLVLFKDEFELLMQAMEKKSELL